MRFTKNEVKDLFFAWLLISVAFAILFTGANKIFSYVFIVSFLISSLTVGIGFLVHELAHKYVAQKYKLKAEFHAFYSMLFLSILMSSFGFIIAAPGAVFIKGKVVKEKHGKIALAGPLTNIILAFLFIFFNIIMSSNKIIDLILVYGFRINSILALFNMLPFMPFDGAKVFVWDKKIYWLMTFIALLLLIIGYIIV